MATGSGSVPPDGVPTHRVGADGDRRGGLVSAARGAGRGLAADDGEGRQGEGRGQGESRDGDDGMSG